MTSTDKKWHIFKPLLILILVTGGLLVLNNYMDFERLKKIHIEKEKKIGYPRVNQKLFDYYEQNQINKFIVTDYQYLMILPDISKYYMYGRIQDLKPTESLLSDEKVGYLLLSTFFEPSKQLPDFIQDSISAGKYKEIFNIDDCIFLKIR